MNDITLVTGGGGFVGKHLVALLRAKGENVRSLDLAPPASSDDVQGSITSEDDVRRAMQGVSHVFHLAGNAQLWAKDNQIFDAVNKQGTAIVVEAALHAGVSRFVHCSSLTTLVGKATPVGYSSADETAQIPPDEMLGAYPKSKREAELIVETAVKEKGLDAVIALPTEPLGPGDEALTPPTQMILDFANGDTPAYIDCVLNFVPVQSLAEGLVAARDRGGKGERYLLGGRNLKMPELLSLLEKLSGRRMPKTKLPYWIALAAGAVDTGVVARLTGKPPKAPLTGVRLAGRNVSFSSDKALRELGWQAGDVEAALSATLDWMKDRGLLKTV